jgi:hypothetical protein
MNSIRLKSQSLCLTASAMSFLFATLNGGCSSSTCAPYGCLNAAHLSGSVVIAKEVTVVDYQLCDGITCKEDSIDLAGIDAGTPCVLWDAGPKICLTKTSDSDTFALSAISSQFAENEDPPNISLQLTLIDHVSGRILLEETRTAKSRVTSNDDCHACWTAEATL